MPADDIIREHYRRLADTYTDVLSYSATFIRWHTAAMIARLGLEPDDVLVDLGAGTGMYTADILQQVPLRRPAIVVDPFPEMLAQIADHVPVERVVADALEFAAQPRQYDKVLMKEAVHHVAHHDELFGRLFERLPSNGRLLLVHVPPELDYPLFRAALDRARRWHADPDELTAALTRTGFGVERERRTYRHRIPTEHYLQMVADRYMSVLSSFTDAELDAGLTEMRTSLAHREVLEFDDRFDYLTAVKQE